MTILAFFEQVLLGKTPPAVGRSGGDFANAATGDDDHTGIDAALPPPPHCDLGTLDLQPLSGEDRLLMLKDGIEARTYIFTVLYLEKSFLFFVFNNSAIAARFRLALYYTTQFKIRQKVLLI